MDEKRAPTGSLTIDIAQGRGFKIGEEVWTVTSRANMRAVIERKRDGLIVELYLGNTYWVSDHTAIEYVRGQKRVRRGKDGSDRVTRTRSKFRFTGTETVSRS